MIFVTVGTHKFDELVQEVDRLAEAGRLPAKAVIQIARGTYQPRHCEWFRMAPTLQPYFDRASLVISHGGSTMHQVLKAGRRLIAIANPALAADDHQRLHIKKLDEEGYLLACTNLADLEQLILSTRELRPYVTHAEALIDELRRYIEGRD